VTGQQRSFKGGKKSTNVGKIKLKDNRKRTQSSRQWLLRQLNDPYVTKAQDLGYRSRAAFKLKEINEKFHFLKPGITVIDLGAAPGGWSQVIVEKLKAGTSKESAKKSKIIAIDLQEITPLKGVTILCGDFTKQSTTQAIYSELDTSAPNVDVVLSDMASPATGINDVDHIRIMNLIEEAYEFARDVLKPGGTFVAKVLQGGTEGVLLQSLKKSFKKVVHFKPEASRKDSAEMYVVAQGFRGARKGL